MFKKLHQKLRAEKKVLQFVKEMKPFGFEQSWIFRVFALDEMPDLKGVLPRNKASRVIFIQKIKDFRKACIKKGYLN